MHANRVAREIILFRSSVGYEYLGVLNARTAVEGSSGQSASTGWQSTWHRKCGIVPLRLHCRPHVAILNGHASPEEGREGEAPRQHPSDQGIREAVDRRPVARTERESARAKKIGSCFAFAVAVVQHSPSAADVRLSHSSTGREHHLPRARLNFWAGQSRRYHVPDDRKLIELARPYCDGFMQRHYTGGGDSGAYE
ncbi:hypothetical protein MPDQ_007788 [Monascus purpureus]|uniref:Uncharacterized protein n=1 Tax=Monascus purpureus TaxID=5098 RepID=A0A507QVI7_MONPU|nr:hypothetical protein MPDQ_007788 [Monascus purpureus]BDD57583.1 hypothetical protein MAP00_002936 [Monascus purpureus]